MSFRQFDSDTEQLIFFKWKGENYGSSILFDHKSIFHYPPKVDIWRYKGYLDEELIVKK